jgi:hypothetical protein
MSIITTRHPSRHRPAPIREAVVLRCKNPVADDPPQREITEIRFVMMKLKHLNDIFVSQVGTIIMSNGRAAIQIPIDRRLR